jgi:hypothetical protein
LGRIDKDRTGCPRVGGSLTTRSQSADEPQQTPGTCAVPAPALNASTKSVFRNGSAWTKRKLALYRAEADDVAKQAEEAAAVAAAH